MLKKKLKENINIKPFSISNNSNEQEYNSF